MRARSDIKIVEDKRCVECKTLFNRKRFDSGRLEDLTAFGLRAFCSLSCANSQTKGGASRSASHVQARKQIGGRCESCGASHGLVVHHCNEDWTDNDGANLQTLCDTCHKSWHASCRAAGTHPAGRKPEVRA